MQDEIRDKSVALSIQVSKNSAKLTADLLKWAIRQYFKGKSNPKVPHGKQSVKQLVKQGAGVQNIEITDQNIKSFEKVAKKYGVDFALRKDISADPPKYLVFFKGKDADALNSAFCEFTAKTLNKNMEKPSLIKLLNQFKEVVKNTVKDKVKSKRKEAVL